MNRDSFICDESRQVSVSFILVCCYGVASISRFLKIIGLFCKRALLKRLYSAKETYNFKESTTKMNETEV